MKYLILFFKLQVFIATQGVGTHHKKLSNNITAAPEFCH